MMVIRIIKGTQSACVAATVKRSFFASSTDHTRLLQDAEVHRLPHGNDGTTQYVMVAAGSETEMVKKVPQLHLARLYVTHDCLHGAKVINKTLGHMEDVCGKLVDAALADIPGQHAKARSNLHGLSPWVLKGASGDPNSDHTSMVALRGYSPQDRDAVAAIATARYPWSYDDELVYDAGKDLWEQCAREFIKQKHSHEAELYKSKGAKLDKIEHRADKSDYASTCGGAMAFFKFP